MISKKILIIIPTFNEENNLPNVLSNIPKNVGTVLVIDNASTDNTVNVIKEYNVKRLLHKRNQGKAASLIEGIKYAIDNNFDVVTMAFGIRNIADPMIGLNEMLRVLKKDGRAIILEFSFPTNIILKKLQILYLRIFIPLIGGILSGNFRAYYYLSQTIQEFPYAEKFTQLMRNAGFRDVKANPLFLGIATIYHGDK